MKRRINHKAYAIHWPPRFGRVFDPQWVGRKVDLQRIFGQSFGCNVGTGDMKDVRIVPVYITEAPDADTR